MKTLSPRQAAAIIGCSPQHVRTLIRAGTLPATTRETQSNRHGYEYRVKSADAKRYRDVPQGKGFPRGQKRN